ncbi:MAG: M24 family metallopeptidase [bacterium]|nr:M24 family metallopeptidase [bacterium]
MNKSAYLIFDSHGAEIRHRSGLTAPDPFIYLQPEGEKPVVYFSSLEYGAQKDLLAQLNNGVKIERIDLPPLIALIVILQKKKITTVKVPPSFPFEVAKIIEKKGITPEIHDFEAERAHKNTKEIDYLTEAQRINETAFSLVYRILSESKIKKDRIYFDNEILTSEKMKVLIAKHLLEADHSNPEGIIVASGKQATQPHNDGTGPLLPNQTIVVDIFPRSSKTGYFGDMTRTFVKGKASNEIKKMYSAVEETQKKILESINIGDSCAAVHQIAVANFKKLGYITTKNEGFIHGTGHSLGLNIHELPRLNAISKSIIEPGMIFTVEPGLYYKKIGGIRLEDIVAFLPNGEKKFLNNFNQSFIIP